MSDHELSPAHVAASVGLSDEVLERAAEAVYDGIGHIALAESDDRHLPDEFTEEEYNKWEWDVPYTVFKDRGMAVGCDEGFAHRDLARIVNRVLPVVVPAIREALVREMIADAGEYQLCLQDSEGNYGVEVETLQDWLREYLPANEEGAS